MFGSPRSMQDPEISALLKRAEADGGRVVSIADSILEELIRKKSFGLSVIVAP